jgi:hypothetical protein
MLSTRFGLLQKFSLPNVATSSGIEAEKLYGVYGNIIGYRKPAGLQFPAPADK